MIGTTDSADFLTATSCALGSKFLAFFVVDDTLEASSDSLRDGRKAELAPLAAVGSSSFGFTGLRHRVASSCLRRVESWQSHGVYGIECSWNSQQR